MLRPTFLMSHPARSCGVAALATMYRLRPKPSASSHTLRRQGYFPHEDTLCVARRYVSMGKPSHVNRSPMINGNYIKHNEPFETKIEIENSDEVAKAAKKDGADGEQEEVSPGNGVGSGTIIHDTNASDAAAEATLAARRGHQSVSEKVSESRCFTCASDASRENLKRPDQTPAATSTAAKTSTEAGAKEPKKATKTGSAPAAASPASTTEAPKAGAPKITITTSATPANGGNSTGIKARADGVVISEKVSDIPVRRVLEKVWEHLWPKKQPVIRLLVVGSVLCVLLAKVLKVALPFWFKSVIDVLSGGATAATATATLGPVTLGAFGLVTAYGICRLSAVTVEELKTVLFAPVGGHSSTALAMQMVDKLHQLDLSFHLNRETGVLSKDLDRGSRAFWTLAYSLLFMVVPTAFEMGLVCTALNTQAGPQFIIIAVVAVVAYVSWTLIITNWRAKFRSRYNALDSRVGGLIVDSLLNFETVKYFGSEKYESARIRKETTNMNHQLVILDQTVAVLNYGQQLIFVTAAVLSLYFATCGVLAGVMTVGDLVLVDALLMQLFMPLNYLGMIYREIQTSTQNMQAMIALLDQKSSVNESADAKPYVYKDGTIELRDVTFEYRKEQDRVVLKNLSLTIPGGQTVAFVGPSGSGKSTIFRLLFRFFDPTSGEILFDGQPLSQLKLESVRNQMGVIPQDTVLFNETVMYNIRYSKLDATDEEVHEAAQKASLHDAVMHMENGYDTPVGERGLKLSGGEKQRVAIARVLLDDPPIILADEATSALDSTTELNVMETLRSVTGREKPRTTILIAHRLTTVKQADIIFVLDGKGGLAEQGSHAELLSMNGLYAKLWNQQLKDHRRATAEVPKEE